MDFTGAAAGFSTSLPVEISTFNHEVYRGEILSSLRGPVWLYIEGLVVAILVAMLVGNWLCKASLFCFPFP